VSEGVGASGEDLDEGEGSLDLVGVLLGTRVHVVDALALRSVSLSSLSGVDVVGETVAVGARTSKHREEREEERKERKENARDELLAEGNGLVTKDDPEVLRLSPGALDGVRVDLLNLAVEVGLLVRVGLGRDTVLLVDLLPRRGTGLGVVGRPAVNDVTLSLLAKTVVDNLGAAVGGVGRSGAEPESGAEEEVVPADGCGSKDVSLESAREREERARRTVVLLDNLGVNVGNPEEDREGADDGGGTDDGGSESRLRELVETEGGGTLEDDGHGHDGGGEEEDEGTEGEGGEDLNVEVLANEDGVLDEEVEDSSETTGDGGSDDETGEDGLRGKKGQSTKGGKESMTRTHSETLSSVPSPSDRVGTSGSNTDTSNGRDDGVSGLRGKRQSGNDGVGSEKDERRTETGHERRVQIMSQVAEVVRATVKARS
jgi:hypothetical protein